MTLEVFNGAMLFFFDFARRTAQHFERLFKPTDKGTAGTGEHATAVDDGLADTLSRYGWYHVLMDACDRDLTKLDTIVQKKAWELFTYMTYIKDYNYVKHTILQRNSNSI
jgi:hypothetical protein